MAMTRGTQARAKVHEGARGGTRGHEVCGLLSCGLAPWWVVGYKEACLGCCPAIWEFKAPHSSEGQSVQGEDIHGPLRAPRP